MREDDGDAQARWDQSADIRWLREYGGQHPDVWGGLWVEGPRVAVTFTNPEAHAAYLRSEVARPSLLDVRRALRTAQQLGEIRAAVDSRLQSERGRWHLTGTRKHVVMVGLRGDAVDLAAELHDRFGDALALTVGQHAYPPDPSRVVQPQPGPVSTIDIPGLWARAVPDAQDLPAGPAITGVVELRNCSAGDLSFQTDQPLMGYLLDGTGDVAGVFTGVVVGTGLTVALRPAGHRSVAFQAGTASRDPSLGWVLPAGRYQLVVAIPVDHDDGDDHYVDAWNEKAPRRRQLVTPACWVAVAPPVDATRRP
ncbi:MAG: hypothetical protein ACR2JQ_04715 [Mycobacteriales bacterium]